MHHQRQEVLEPDDDVIHRAHLVLVKSGELTLYEGKDSAYRGTVYKAGQSFVDRGFGNVHVARNESSGNVELWVMYLAPAAAGQPVRIDRSEADGVELRLLTSATPRPGPSSGRGALLAKPDANDSCRRSRAGSRC